MSHMIDRQAATFLLAIADALHDVPVEAGQTSYGEFYVTEVHFGFEGEEAGYRIVSNEHGDFDLIGLPA